jgi:aminoglycoside phosphotransferase (APT) family kinase protein
VRFEPAINHARLIETVREEYGIPAQDLDFVPVGFVAACYVVNCAGGERFFLKIWPQLRVGRAAARRQYAALALTRALYDRGLYRRVPYPIPTRSGSLWADLTGMPFAVAPLLPGNALPAQVPAVLRTEFARALATIHRATPSLADLLPPRESFAIPGKVGLERCLAVVERIGTAERPGLRALRRLLLPRREEILAQHARLRRLRATVRRLDGPFVLCHTDLLGDNALVDDQGRLSLLDWDDATVAPPEHDLWAAAGEGFGTTLEAYHRAGGAQPLHLDHFAFYLLRRYLGDMVARLERILDQASAEKEDEELLRGMEAYGFARWAALDQTLTGIADVLPQRGR